MTTIDEPVTHNHPSRQYYGRDKVVEVAGEAKDCVECRPREWVARFLEQYTVPKGSKVVMGNVSQLAEALVEEFLLDEWFETWDDPPEFLA